MSAGPGRGTAVVIGAGIAGLATGALLAREGYSVTIVEARDEIGGRAGSWESEGFRFDTGPSWYLMPEVFDHFFRLLGTSAAEQLELRALDPAYRIFFQDEEACLDIVADRESNLGTFESIEPGAGVSLGRYLASAEDTYRMAVNRFLYSTFASYRSLAAPDVLVRMGRLMRMLFQPLDRFVRRFVRDPRLQKILGYPAVFLGSSPSRAPSMYHLMSALDLGGGVLYPDGGLTRVIQSVARRAQAEGAKILTGSEVEEITTARGQTGGPPNVTGVRILGPGGAVSHLPADLVVSTADLHHTETQLLPEGERTYPEKWWKSRVAGPSAVLVFLGVEGALPKLAHHNLFFTSDWDENFARIFDAPTAIPEPASIYVCRPSATDPSVAPAGFENLFVLIPVPADPEIGAGGAAAVERAADRAVTQIAEWAGVPDLAERIVLRRTIGPADFADEFHSWEGSALGPAHTLRQSAFLRGKNVSAKVGGLYFAGATSVPGIGLPMCLISAELVIKRLRADTSSAPLPEPL